MMVPTTAWRIRCNRGKWTVSALDKGKWLAIAKAASAVETATSAVAVPTSATLQRMFRKTLCCSHLLLYVSQLLRYFFTNVVDNNFHFPCCCIGFLCGFRRKLFAIVVNFMLVHKCFVLQVVWVRAPKWAIVRHVGGIWFLFAIFIPPNRLLSLLCIQWRAKV